MIRLRNGIISLFVIIFIFCFHYESVRYFYLERWLNKPLPKIKFLFPPAGWIMFFNVNDGYGGVEVYGVKGQNLHLIDPHDIFRTRTIMFDNIHRNILSNVANPHAKDSFCRFLDYRFPEYDNFVVLVYYYSSLTKKPVERLQQVKYQCEM